MRTERCTFGSTMRMLLAGVPLALCAAAPCRVGPLSAAETEPRAVLRLDSPLDYQIAQVSYHLPGAEASPDICAAQASLWRDGIALEGPDSDAARKMGMGMVDWRKDQGKD